MNITLNIPAASFERLLNAIERVAIAAERLAGPVIEPIEPKPFSPDYWGTSSNVQSIQIEEEDHWAAAGYGKEYREKFEAQLSDANRVRNLANTLGQGPPEDPSVA